MSAAGSWRDGDYCPCGAHVIGTPCYLGYDRQPAAELAAGLVGSWCGYCGEPVPTGGDTCRNCADLPALELPYALFPRDRGTLVGDRLAGSRQLAERRGILGRVVEPSGEPRLSLAAGCAIALVAGLILWAGVYLLLRLLFG